jgi:tRNA pseudouridine38-40 synthase
LTSGTTRYRVDLAYDGTDFSGWQIQPDARTVQGTLEEVLTRLAGGTQIRVAGAGRTDAGAHARGQVAAWSMEIALEDGDLEHALRRMLPEDVRPRSVRPVSARFDPQRNAISKTYRYRLDRSRAGSPFLARYALHHPHELDRAAVVEALRRLPGRRDWTGFAGAACDVGDRVRNLVEARMDEAPEENVAWFTFTADGFLNHMVRNLVGTLLEIGRGRFTPDRIDRVLSSGDRGLAGPTAPAKGLFLWQVEYPDEIGSAGDGDRFRA